MTAYLDWDKAEDKRVQVIVDDYGDGICGHRGMDYIRKMVDREMGLDSVEFLDAVKEVRTIPVENKPSRSEALLRHPTGGCVSL